MNKKEILESIKEAIANPTKGANSMGCAEANYNPYYMIGKCFPAKTLLMMTKEELNNLIKLAEYASESFY